MRIISYDSFNAIASRSCPKAPERLPGPVQRGFDRR